MAKRNHFRSEQQKTYRTQRFRNPYFQTKSIKAHWILFAGGLFVVICCIGLGLLLTSERFMIRFVEVKGTKYFSEDLFKEQVLSYLFKPSLLVINHRNQFVFDPQELQSQLETVFQFESIVIQRDGQKVRISVKEKQSQIIWYTGSMRYLVDLEGVVIRELSPEEEDLLEAPPAIQIEPTIQLLRELPIYIDRNNTPVNVGDHVLTKNEIEQISRFSKKLGSIHLVQKSIQVDRLAGKWMGVRTNDEYDILFDATGDIDAQFVRLETLLKEKITDPSSLQYIDLRFGDHVYFQ